MGCKNSPGARRRHRQRWRRQQQHRSPMLQRFSALLHARSPSKVSEARCRSRPLCICDSRAAGTTPARLPFALPLHAAQPIAAAACHSDPEAAHSLEEGAGKRGPSLFTTIAVSLILPDPFLFLTHAKITIITKATFYFDHRFMTSFFSIH